MLKKMQTPVLNLMRLHRYRIQILLVASAALGCFAQPISAQESGKVIAPLQIKSPYQQSLIVARIEFDEGNSWPSTDKTKPRTVRLGHLPGGLRVAVETIAESTNSYRLRIDTNGDNDLADESPLLVNLDSSVTVNITRRWENRKTATLTYTLSYSRGTENQESFHWRPNYMAEGKLKVRSCEAIVNVLDANGDGVFDRRDFRNATTIRIDDGGSGDGISLNDPRVIKHSDGRIEIPEEPRRSIKRKWLRGEEIIEFCGGFYLVDRVEPDGSALTLVRSDLKVPRVGEPVPALAMTTLDDQAIDMKSLKGSVTLLDFWASWCRPCVEKFAAVKQMVESYKGDIRVIAINVDESERLPMAHQVIKEYKLTWPHVATGLGEKDPLWKVFGSMSNNGLSIPLYVLVDSKSIIKYAGDGGKDLTELRAKVKELEQNKSLRTK